MWNDYVWNTYKESSGADVIDMFERSFSNYPDDSYSERVKSLLRVFVASADTMEDIVSRVSDAVEDMKVDEDEGEEDMVSANLEMEDDELKEEFKEIDEWFLGFCMDIMECKKESDINYRELFQAAFTSELAYYTMYFSIVCQTWAFIPYYFFSTYNVLNKVADTFDIRLPEIPQKSDYKGRVWHYANICKVLYAFRVKRRMSYGELLAFLYDFGPKYIGGIDSYIVRELPQPKAAFFVGGNGKGLDAMAADNPDNIRWWQCNPDTRAGDMIVMYLRTPISAISSLWRAYSVGFIDPFFWYYRMTYIGNPVKVKNITLSEIKKDEILGKMPIVSKNLQGINGVELFPSEYNHIAELCGNNFPRLEYVMDIGDKYYPNEKAVEDQLIKPLLKKLGYSMEEYVQQMYIEIGNHNHALIPDFVINPVQVAGHQSGFAVIEAKRSIKNKKEMEAAKGQVRGYAKLLGARYSVVISKEKICVMGAADDYTKEIFSEFWEQIADADIMYKLKKLIGK